jgi:hypothetical protein
LSVKSFNSSFSGKNELDGLPPLRKKGAFDMQTKIPLKKSAWAAALVLTFIAATHAAPAAGAHREVWVRTDRSVDCSSLDAIIRDVIKPGMTDEQKVLALFNFYREHVFHFFVTPDGDHTLKLLNILGYTLCGSQGATNCELLRKAGFDARVVCWPNGAHTFYEVHYDGKWHVLDTMTNFYVYTRGEDRHIASMEELKADPSLALKAVEEKRACPGFLMCGDPVREFTKGARTLGRNAKTGEYDVKKLALHKGMEFIRFWVGCDKPCPGSFDAKYVGPLHACGGKDENSAENFHNWEPYLVRNMGSKTRVYRHWGSGRVIYSPDFRAGAHTSSALVAENLALGKDGEPALRPAAANQPAVWAFEIRTPYYLTECVLNVNAVRKTAADVLKAEVSVDGGKTWTTGWTAEGEGAFVAEADLASLVVKNCPGRFDYRLRFVMQAAQAPGDVGINNIFLRTSFQHNAMSAPRLRPGKNVVTVEAAPTEGKPFEPFDVIYRYQAGPNWDAADVQELKWTVDKNPATFEAELPVLEGNKQHRMKSLTYRCGQIAWRPKPLAPLIVDDFKNADAAEHWKGGASSSLTRDDQGLLLKLAPDGTYPETLQRTGLNLNASAYKYLLVDFENLGGAWRGLDIGLIAAGKPTSTPWLLYSHERPRIKIPLTYFKADFGKIEGVFIKFPRAPKAEEQHRLHTIQFLTGSDED